MALFIVERSFYYERRKSYKILNSWEFKKENPKENEDI